MSSDLGLQAAQICIFVQRIQCIQMLNTSVFNISWAPLLEKVFFLLVVVRPSDKAIRNNSHKPLMPLERSWRMQDTQ